MKKKPPVQYAMLPPRVDAPQIAPMKPVQQPKVAPMRGIDEALDYYLGPTGIPERLRAVNSMFNPVEAVGGSMRASQRLFAPETDGWGRVQAAGDMLSGIGGFVAPMVAASKVGGPVASAVVDAFTGINTAPATQAAKTMATDFATGDSGAFAGWGARTADLAKMREAGDMARNGASREDIWNATGWFKGVDGRWRFEIDDSGMSLTDQATAALQPKAGYDLEADFASAVNHPDLSANYDMSKGDFALGSYGVNAGAYYPSTGAIRIKATDPVEARSTTLHEIQHHIQKLEGFASGSSPSEMASAHLGMARRVSDHSDAVAVLREVQANGGDWDAAIKDMRDIGIDVSDDGIILARKFGTVETAQRAYNEMAAAKMKLEPMRDPGQWHQDVGYGPYKRTAGEVEARNVQMRANMTPAERLATPPWTTQDVPDDQQLLVFGDSLQLSAPMKAPDSSLPPVAPMKPLTPDDLEKMLRDKYPGVKLSLSGDAAKGYTLNRIEVPKDARGEGVGSRVMADLVSEADKMNAPLRLSPSGDFGGSPSRLRDFYKRFGFVDNAGKNKDFGTRETMLRTPQEIIKKYGIAGLMMGGGAMAQPQQQGGI